MGNWQCPLEDMVMDPVFWRNRKVLITGHTGFKGSWLSLWLQKMGADVTGYSLDPPTIPNFFTVGGITRDMVSVYGDVCDLESLKDAVMSHQPEIIIHMAAQSLVRYSYKHPVETYSTNVMGTVNILETVRQLGGVKVVLVITSDKCYENRGKRLTFRESDPMGGYDPYSSSKGCAELVTAAYRNSFFSPEKYSSHGVSIASTRAGNVIGGGDWGEDRLLPDIMRSILTDQAVTIRNPAAVRPWQHVLEPLSGYLRLAEQLWIQGGEYAGGWNFGPDIDDCKSVRWILEALNQQWPGGIKWVTSSAENPHEAAYLSLDCSKAKRLLGWSPRLNLSSALGLSVDWYQGYVNNDNMRELSINQLEYFENLT